jgi:hypothetical protein
MEHYFRKEDLCTKNEKGRRLFLGSKFLDSGESKCENGLFRVMMRRKELENRINKNGIIDEDVYDDEHEKSIILSKTNFADLVANNDKFTEKFELIFNKIK